MKHVRRGRLGVAAKAHQSTMRTHQRESAARAAQPVVPVGNELQRRIELSEREVELLRYLVVNAGRAISRDEILTRVWRLNPARIETRTIDMHIANLRAVYKHVLTAANCEGSDLADT